MHGSLLAMATVLAVACTAAESPPWLDPGAVDDATWGRFCGPKEKQWIEGDGAAARGLAARTYHWWETEGFGTNGVSVWCSLERDKKDGTLLELNTTVAWFAKVGRTWHDAQPIIDRITEEISQQLKPRYRPTITLVTLGPYSTWGRTLSAGYRASGGFEWEFNRWHLRVWLREVGK